MVVIGLITPQTLRSWDGPGEVAAYCATDKGRFLPGSQMTVDARVLRDEHRDDSAHLRVVPRNARESVMGRRRREARRGGDR